jgi:hypothetical protein
MKKHVVIFLMIGLLIIACSVPKVELTIAEGEDWTLPEGVIQKEYGGLAYQQYLLDEAMIDERISLYLCTTSWNDLNPTDDVYDFTPIDDFISEAESHNLKGIVMRMKASVVSRDAPWDDGPVQFIPQWVLDKHNPNTFPMSDTILEVAAPWDSGVQAEYHEFIQAFADAGYFSNDMIQGIYLHGISSSYGEEFWCEPDFMDDAESAGMSDQILYDTFKQRIDWWVEEAGDTHTGKIAWIGVGWFPDYEIVDGLDDYAVSQGLGIRHGGFDVSHYTHYPDAWGQYWEEDHYAMTDWDYVLRKEQRIIADELEYHGALTMTDIQDTEFPDYTPEVNFSPMSALYRASVFGMNTIWTAKDIVDKIPDMYRWYSYTAGKLPDDSPDASIWLKEGYVRWKSTPNSGWDTDHAWKNFERFIYQRDYSPYQTRPALKLYRESYFSDPSNLVDNGMMYEYTARATDTDNGQNGMLFLLHEDFINKVDRNFQIKVTYFDAGVNKWNIEVSTNKGILATEHITGAGDGKWRTATMSVTGVNLSDEMDYNATIRINLISGADVVVRYVRVIDN